MKQYKLIKNYPENRFPLEGLVFERDGMYYNYPNGVDYYFRTKDIEEFPEFWQKLELKEHKTW